MKKLLITITLFFTGCDVPSDIQESHAQNNNTYSQNDNFLSNNSPYENSNRLSNSEKFFLSSARENRINKDNTELYSIFKYVNH